MLEAAANKKVQQLQEIPNRQLDKLHDSQLQSLYDQISSILPEALGCFPYHQRYQHFTSNLNLQYKGATEIPSQLQQQWPRYLHTFGVKGPLFPVTYKSPVDYKEDFYKENKTLESQLVSVLSHFFLKFGKTFKERF